MKHMKFSTPTSAADKYFFTILRWYLVGSSGLLIFLIVLQWLLQ